MSKILRNFLFIVLFSAACPSFAMGPEPDHSLKRVHQQEFEEHAAKKLKSELESQLSLRIKIQTSDEEFEVERQVARVSATIKNMIEDIPEHSEMPLPLPQVSGEQFKLLLPAMQKLAELPSTEIQESKEELVGQIAQALNPQLSNMQLIEFIAGANYLELPFVELALNALAERILNKDELQKLEELQDKFKDLFRIHPTWKIFQREHLGISEIVEFRGGGFLSRCEGGLKVWDKSFKEEPITLLEHISGFEESKDGNLITYSDNSNYITIRFRSFRDPICLRHAYVNEVKETRDGKLISAGGGKFKVWDNKTFKKLATFRHEHTFMCEERGDGNIVSNSDEDIKVWDKNTFQELMSYQRQGKSMRLVCIESKDGNYIIVDDNIIKVWDQSYKELITVHLSGMPFGVKEISGGNLVAGYRNGTIKVWDQSFKELITLHIPGELVEVKEISGGNLVAWAINGTIKVWDQSFKELITLHIPGGLVEVKEISGGNVVAWARNRTLKVWDQSFKELITVHLPGTLLGVAEISGGNLVAWARNGTIKVWDRSFKELGKFYHPGVIGLIESMGGNLISTSRDDGMLRVWDTAFLNPTPELMQLILSVYFVSKGQVFELTSKERDAYKGAFNSLTPMIQSMLEKQAPNFIARIKAEK